jgi:hypothetical protein
VIAGGASTIADIVEWYDFTRNTPFESEETLLPLGSDIVASHSEEVFQQLPEDLQQHGSTEFSEKVSRPPATVPMMILANYSLRHVETASRWTCNPRSVMAPTVGTLQYVIEQWTIFMVSNPECHFFPCVH